MFRLLRFLDARWGRGALFGLAFLVFVADQGTKWLVRRWLPAGGSWSPAPEWSEVFQISHVQNSGAAFGLFPAYGLIFAAVAIAVVVAILLYSRFLSSARGWVVFALGLQLGGAAGNLLDRLRFGYVTDFIDISIWPVFNIADASVVLGVIALGYFVLFVEGKPQAEERGGRASEAQGESSPQ